MSTDIEHLRCIAKLQTDDWIEAEMWCEENIGPCIETWYKLGADIIAHANGDNTTIWYFKDEHSRTMFLLRWQ